MQDQHETICGRAIPAQPAETDGLECPAREQGDA